MKLYIDQIYFLKESFKRTFLMHVRLKLSTKFELHFQTHDEFSTIHN